MNLVNLPAHKYFVPLMDNGDGKAFVRFMRVFLEALNGHAFEVAEFSGSHPGRTRNQAAASFLQTDCTHLLFIDADITRFSAEHVRLLHACDEDIVAGLYPKKMADKTEWCLVPLPAQEGGFVTAGKLVEVKRAGTGFLRISRKVLERLQTSATADKYANHGRDEWDFFKSGVVYHTPDGPVPHGEWLSEDWYFCDMARTVGFRIMAHTGIQLGHLGQFEYPAKVDRLTWCPPQMRYHIERIWEGEYYIHGLQPRTVLDIGANIGGFATWAREIWPDCRVYSYEPHPQNCDVFDMNTAGDKGISLHRVAVLGKGGECLLGVSANNIGEHSFYHGAPQRKVAVWAVAASQLPRADFVKIDTEGCEYEILLNMDLSATQGIALEYHRASDEKSITDFLRQKGFVMWARESLEPERGVLKFIRKP